MYSAGDQEFKVSDPVFARRKNKEITGSPKLKNEEQLPEKDVSEQVLTSVAGKPKAEELKSDVSGRLSVSSYSNFSNSLDGQIYGARLSKDIIPGKFYGTLNYRHVEFKYASTSSRLRQHIGEIDLSYQLSKKWYFSVNFEATLQESEDYNRLYLNLRRKF